VTPSSTSFGKFSIKLIGSYLLWKGISYLLDTYQPALWLSFKESLSTVTVRVAAWLCHHIIQLPVMYTTRNLLLDGTKGIFVADHCLGVPVMVVFVFFITVYEGPWRHKLWFIPLGLMSIIFINAIRIASLVYLQLNASEFYFYINHSYFYLIAYYGFVFMMIIWWLERFAHPKTMATR
jgi:exosortase/archaeosortase family protein